MVSPLVPAATPRSFYQKEGVIVGVTFIVFAYFQNRTVTLLLVINVSQKNTPLAASEREQKGEVPE
jgi:hypothetical protein